MKKLLILLLLVSNLSAVEINVDAFAGRKAISPYLFGRNNSLSDDPDRPLSQNEWQFFRDAGIRMFRECGGNNATKYNWERKLSSHPDWYNNVYSHDWDYAAESLAMNMTDVQGMWAFQLIGKAASSSAYNFNDWEYNRSQWWEGVRNNWAGGGGPDFGDGDPDLYLMDWPPESTAGILNHWFEELGLDKTMFQYWCMDNEPEIWSGTHDDVYPEQPPVEDFMSQYIKTAKLARALFPEIKLVAPAPANEWQWYNWDNNKISSGGKSYTWLEYFIKRIGEEQNASGVRLLDVLDVHFYPNEEKASDIVQLHRVWFDRSYEYPGANGVKRAGSGAWSDGITKEYIFERCREWLEKHITPDHGVSFGVTEMGIKGSNPNVTAVWYASTLGVFCNEGVELFAPWTWKTGMWEVLHLFSKYCKDTSVLSRSDDEETISAYSSINNAEDSLTVILVNREINESREVTVNLDNFLAADGDYGYLMLSGLPVNETFNSAADNALKSGAVCAYSGSFTLTLPALSITAVLLTGESVASSVKVPEIPDLAFIAYPNPFNPVTHIAYTLPRTMNVRLELFDLNGRFVRSIRNRVQQPGSYTLRFDGSDLSTGVYFLRLTAGGVVRSVKILLLR